MEVARFRRRSEEIGGVKWQLFLAHSHLSKLIGESVNWGLAILGLLVERRSINILWFTL